MERYSRQITLKGFGVINQQKLAAAKVLVIGAGGLGCPALQYLAAAGVGKIGIADDDVVSLSNLHRQILYTTADIGLLKVERAVAILKRLNPDITLVAYPIKIQTSTALKIIAQYDIVIDGTDNFASRYLINDACVLLNKTLIYGAVSQYQGQVAVFNLPGKNGATNYRDVFAEPPKSGEVANCEIAGVLGVLPGIIGTMQAAEVIKLITGIGTPLVNQLLIYNLLNNDIYKIEIASSKEKNEFLPADENEFLKMNYENFCNMPDMNILEIDAAEFEQLRIKESTLVVDVREVYELPKVTGIAHEQMPMSVFKTAMVNIQQDNIILFCQHGIRSLHAGEILQQKFGNSKNIYSLRGGISRWADQLL